MRFLPRLALFLVLPSLLSAQVPVKGQYVLFTAPSSILDTFRFRPYPREVGGRDKSLGAVLALDEGGRVTLNGAPDWRSAGFPIVTALKVENVKRRKKEGDTIVRLGRRGFVGLILVMPTESEADIWPHVVVDTLSADSLLTAARDSLRPQFFQGELAVISRPTQDALMEWFRLGAGTFAVEEFKEQRYFLADLGELEVVYNDLQLNESDRVAEVVKTRLLDVLKSFSKVGREVSSHGLAVAVGIPHKSFANRYGPHQTDQLRLYVPIERIMAFADADITSQELMESAIVLVNGNRVAVDLSLR